MSLFDALDAQLTERKREREAEAAAAAAAAAATAAASKPKQQGGKHAGKRRRSVDQKQPEGESKEAIGMETDSNNTGTEEKGGRGTKPRKPKADAAVPGYYPLRIRNYVGNFYLDVKLNLWTTCLVMRGRCSFPVFTSGTVKGRLPSIAYEIFENGKIGVTGASSPYHAVTGMWQFCRWVSKILQHKVHPRDFRLHNIVGSVGLGYGLNLDLFFDDYRSTSTYNPDKFPGLHYHMETPRLVLLLYKSGKMVITQGRETTDLLEGFKQIDWTRYRVGHEYRQLDSAHRRTRLSAGQFAAAMETDESGKLATSIQRLNETNSCDCPQPQWVPTDLQDNHWMCLVCGTIAHLNPDG